MITKIEVDGFRSLNDFSMVLNPGVNILVGPNGAGKSNIIMFFEFFAELIRSSLSVSVSSMGGAGTLFRKVGDSKYQETISAQIFGNLVTDDKYYSFEYSFKIEFSKEKELLFYQDQSVRFRSDKKNRIGNSIGQNRKRWDLDISFSKTSQSKIQINKIDGRKIKGRFSPSGGNSKETPNNFYNNMYDLSEYSLLSSLIWLTFGIYPIIKELSGGLSLNIAPSKVLEPEDVAFPPGIGKSGRGLASTLFAIKNEKRRSKQKVPYFFFEDKSDIYYDRNTFSTIISYLNLANSTITNLDVVNEPFENKLVIQITLDSADGTTTKLPLSAMSDGTIKWLTMISAILTTRSIFALEEPENYLHPWMQAEIISIMRNHIRSTNSKRMILVTTHSESLLNSAQPEEIILVSNIAGSTRAKHLSNTENVKEQISSTGFGLGFFYFSNALSDD